MSKVSVTGSKGVMPTVIETVHKLHQVHLSDYDGSWDGFDNGNPIEGADSASEKLVTVRALENKLALARDDVDLERVGLEDDWEDRLEDVRTRVNSLDDERDSIRENLRVIDEQIGRLEPFAQLGIDLDLLSGYEYVDVAVGEGEHDEIVSQLETTESIGAFETFTGNSVVAIVAAPPEYERIDDKAGDGDDENATRRQPVEGLIADALVEVEFDWREIPDSSGSPTDNLSELEAEQRQLETDLAEIDSRLEEIKQNHGGLLLRIEEELTIEVQRAEAPLQFATTERAFVAEGWIPTEQYDALVAAITDAVGDSVDIEELERADYDRHGVASHRESVESAEEPSDAVEEETEDADRKKTVAPDGGTDDHGSAVTMDDNPPVILNNLKPAKPFELMVKLVSQPKYSELDPTLLVFLTFPFAFGFMIGDIGYGILYMLLGYGAWQVFDSDAGKAIGTIGIWAGVFTVVFGYLYDDTFGVHAADYGIELPLMGVFTKGLQTTEWALLWIVLSLLFGLLHLNIGLVVGFVNELRHGIKTAVFERLSWILALNGLFIWIFSLHLVNEKPDFLVGPDGVLATLVGPAGEGLIVSDSVTLGFTGLPASIGVAGLIAAIVGLVMVGKGEGIAGLAETPAWAFGHVLSYLRMVAVLLAKGGMAFVVNILVFGEYVQDGYIYFGLPGTDHLTYEQGFPGLVWIGMESGGLVLLVALVGAVLVFVFGHILVLLLGITAAGIQMLRLEYVEFFQKFYEGGGEEYDPFGYERTGTNEAMDDSQLQSGSRAAD